jgi:hypothetical protein
MISLVLGLLNALAATSPMSAEAAAPPPAVDTSVMDLEQSPEEQMVGGDLPAAPESGSENPEDLLKSGPVIQSTRKPTKSASAKGTSEELPAALPLVPGTGGASSATESADTLPPPPLPDTAVTDGSEPPVESAPAEEMENVVVPAEPSAVAADESSGVSTKKWDRSVPMYERENPSWAVELHGSMEALGSTIKSEELDTNGNGTGVLQESDIRNFGMGFEFEPKFLQSIGVISLGPSFNMYIADPAGDLTSGPLSIFSLGFSAKYQLNFVTGQFLVPFVGYEGQLIRYSFERADAIGTGTTFASGLTFGALIALNWMEPSAARNLWSETGIKRSYLVGEMKNLIASEDLLSSDGPAIYFGLRLEY